MGNSGISWKTAVTRRNELWSDGGWRWRTSVLPQASGVLAVRDENGGWLRRNFDEWIELDERLPVHPCQLVRG